MADYDRGDTATLNIEIRNAAGDLVDPGTLEISIRTPAGVVSTDTHPAAAIVRDATGLFHRDLPLLEDGVYAYQWRTTNPGQVQGGSITVRPAPLDVQPWSLTLDGLKRRMDRELDQDDDKLRDYLAAAVAQMQKPAPNGCGRLLIPDPLDPLAAPVTRTVRVRRGRALIPDASEITSVTVDGAPVTYEVLEKDGYVVQISKLDTDATAAVVTGRFGFTTIPEDLADAIYTLAARMAYEEAAQYADQVEILEGSAVQSYYRQLPPRTKLVISSFAVPRAVAGLA